MMGKDISDRRGDGNREYYISSTWCFEVRLFPLAPGSDMLLAGHGAIGDQSIVHDFCVGYLFALLSLLDSQKKRCEDLIENS